MKLREMLSKLWQGLTGYFHSEDSTLPERLLADGARRLLMNAHRMLGRIVGTYTDRQLTWLTLIVGLLIGAGIIRMF